MSSRNRFILPSLLVALLLLVGVGIFAIDAYSIVEAEEAEAGAAQILQLADGWLEQLQTSELLREPGTGTAPLAAKFARLKGLVAEHFPELLPVVARLSALERTHFRRKGKGRAMPRAAAGETDRDFIGRARNLLSELTGPVSAERARINRRVSFRIVRASVSFALVTALMIGILVYGYRQTVRTLRVEEREHNKLAGIFDASLDALVVMDADGAISQWNRNAEAIFGWRRQEVLGRPLHEIIIPPRFRQAHLQGLRHFVASGEGSMVNVRTETYAQHRDGSEFEIEIAIAPIRLRDGYEFSAFVRDISDAKRAAQALQQESEKNRNLLRASSDGIHILDTEGRVLEVSDAFCQMLGYTQDEMRSMTVFQWDAARAKPELLKDLAALRDENVFLETQHRHRDGHLIDVEISATGVELGGQRMVYASARDITERKRAEAALRKSEEKFSAVFELAPYPTFVVRLDDGMITSVNHSFASYSGYAVADVVGHSILSGDLMLCDGAAGCGRWLAMQGEVGETMTGLETRFRLRSGEERIVSVAGRRIELDGVASAIVVVHDVTEQRDYEAQLEAMAHYDDLTRLPNRVLLFDRMQLATAQNARAGTLLAVCYLDLDGFKAVNDSLGHEAGDQLLVETAERLKRIVRGGDTVARLGGDEFVLLLSGLDDEEECRHIVERVNRSVSEPYSVKGTMQDGISASVGIALFPRDSTAPDTLLRYADQAMYAAKQGGKNRFHMYDATVEHRIEARQSMARRILAALDNGECRLYYQPQVDCRDGRVVGVEALIRWLNPLLGLLTPDEFLPLVEEDEVTTSLGEWVFRQALEQMERWRDEGFELAVSVNVSRRQLLEAGFCDRLQRQLNAFPHLKPGLLTLEVPESVCGETMGGLGTTLETCRALGVRISIDDFGTGTASLRCLQQLDSDEIKIDISFVGHMLEDVQSLSVVRSVIALGASFGRNVVAEGVESVAQMEKLRSLGCHVIQGYVLSPPVEADALLPWLREREVRHGGCA